MNPLNEQSLKIEETVLSHGSRGMDTLKNAMTPGYCLRAARMIQKSSGTILIATGFPVGGRFETDGPVGAIALYGVLERQGYDTRFICAPPLLEILAPSYRTVPFPIADDRTSQQQAEHILAEIKPSLILSIERPGVARNGFYYNMRGRDISSKTARIDWLFNLRKCPTLAIGDGGNEIGMGNIREALTELPITPSVTEADELVIASVSNWGVYGIIRCLEILSRKDLFEMIDRRKIYDFLFSHGAVDGVTGLVERSEDGFSWEIGEEIIGRLKKIGRD